jgi:PPOX class probable F420-dependent enzyme
VLPEDVRPLFERTNLGHVATVAPDGSPHSVAVWVGIEGDHVYFFTQDGSRKARNLALDPRVAISAVDSDNPYWVAWVRGRVVETLTGEAALVLIDRLSERYTGKPFPMRTGIVFLIEPEKTGFMKLPFEPPA